MEQTYRAHGQVSAEGNLTVNDVPFPAGAEVEITVVLSESRNESNGAPPPVDALAVLEALAGTVSAPLDWAAEHDHYLNGAPRRTTQRP